MSDGNEARANFKRGSRGLLLQITDAQTTQSLKAFIVDLENRLHNTDPE